MANCTACAALKHASVTEDPPEVLAVDLVIDRLDGAVCTYRCTICNSTWMRFRANQLYSGRVPVWQAMSLCSS